MPASVKSILEESARLVRENYVDLVVLYVFGTLAFAILFVIFFVFAFFFGILAQLIAGGSGFPFAFAIVFLLIFSMVLLIEPIWLGAYYSLAIQSLNGKASLKVAIEQAMSKYSELFWTMLFEAVIIVIIDLIIFSPLVVPASILLKTFHAIGIFNYTFLLAFLGLLASALILFIIFTMVNAALAPLFFEAVPLVLLKGISGVGAIEESVEIGRKHYKSLIGLVAGAWLVFFIVQVAGGIATFALGIIHPLLGGIVQFIFSLLISSFLYGWLSFIPVLFYKYYISDPLALHSQTKLKR